MENQRVARFRNYFRLLEQMVRQREDVKAYFNLLLTLTAIAFFSWFAIRPTALTIIDLINHIRAQQQTLATLQKKVQAIEQTQRVLGQIQSDLPLIDQAIPSKASPEVYARQIEVLALQKQVTLTTLSTGKIDIRGESAIENKFKLKEQLSPEIAIFSFSLATEGTPEHVLSFITAIPGLRRPLLLDSVSLTGKPPGSATQLSLLINGYVPFLKNP